MVAVFGKLHQGIQTDTNPPSKKRKFVNSSSSPNAAETNSRPLGVPSTSNIPITICRSQTTVSSNIANTSSPLLSSSGPPVCEKFSKKLKQLKMLCQLLRKYVKGTKRMLALHNAASRLSYPLIYDIHTTCNKKMNQKCIATIKILNVVVANGCSSSKKKAKLKSANRAVALLFNPAIFIVSKGGNLVLKEKTDIPLRRKRPPSIATPPQALHSVPVHTFFDTNLSPCPVITTGNNETFPVDPMLKNYFLILDCRALYKTQTAVSTLIESVQFCKVRHEFNIKHCPGAAGPSTNLYCCEFWIENRKISRAFSTERQVKDLAARLALESLCQVVYTVKVKCDSEDGFVVPRSQMLNCPDNSSILTESNIGCKMLKMMGWSGGGIGKEGNTGITEPIKAVGNQHGHGLGYFDPAKDYKTFCSRVASFLHDYVKSKATKELIFSTEFSTEEQAEIHLIAERYHLKNESRGCGEERHLVIGRRLNAQQLLCHLKEAGGSTAKYELIEPSEHNI